MSRLQRRWFMVAAVLLSAVAISLAFNLLPILRGNADWSWPYRPAATRRPGRGPADRAITFAGVSGDIAGCMAWGHRPRLGDALADAHAACILMKRAAFCGEDSDTIDGTRIFVADAFGTQGVPHDRLEAAGGPEGAVCIEPANLRHPELGLPACAAALPRCSTGDVFALGAVASARP